MAGIQRLGIMDLSIHSPTTYIVCVLIGKSDPRYFNRGQSRVKSETTLVTTTAPSTSVADHGVQTLTVRDSERAYINCKIWGSSTFIGTLDQRLHVGDHISIVKPTVSSRPHNEFDPHASSQFQLTVNEEKGDIVSAAVGAGLTDELRINLLEVFNKPLKPTSSAMRLSDVNARGTRSNGELVDLLVVVQRMRPTRQFQGAQRKGNFRDVIVMDGSFGGMTLKLWNGGYVDRSEKWLELSTVLQLIDVRAMYSAYSKRAELATNCRTLIVENPDTPESHSLKVLARNFSIPECCIDDGLAIDLVSITSVMTCQQIVDRTGIDIIGDVDHFTAVVYAVVTRYDLDGCSQIFMRQCKMCRKLILVPAIHCRNDDCIILASTYDASNYVGPSYTDTYDIRINISDLTGTLEHCRLAGVTAERIIGSNLSDFQKLSDADRGKLKWQLLLERCKLKLSIKRKAGVQRSVLVSVLDCIVVAADEVVANIKAY